MPANERKNMLAVVFGALLITACCAAHLILAGGLAALAGFLTWSGMLAAVGLVVLPLGAFLLARPAKKNKDK